MKKLFILLLVCTFGLTNLKAGVVFFETCGENAPSTGTRPSPANYTGWDNQSPIVFDGNADVRSTNLINSHVWLAATTTANPERNLIISGINTENKSNLYLSFDLAANVNNAAATNLHVKVKDLVGGSESNITIPNTTIPTANTYIAINNLAGIPATSNLQITFSTNETNTAGYRLDNILITDGEALSGNNNLKSLTVSKGTLQPAFAPEIVAYAVVLSENDTEAPSITCETDDSNATVALTEPESVPGTATVVVTAENGNEKTYTVNYSNAIPANAWIESFETATTKDAYAVADYQGTAALWEVAGVVRNDDDDKRNGLMSARLRDPNDSNPETYSYLLMKEDKANGAGIITLYHGMYSNHTGGAYRLEVSNDGGVSWNAFQEDVNNIPPNLTLQSFTVNVAGNIRIKITKQSSGRNSFNIDDIYISDYTSTGTTDKQEEAPSVYSSGNTVFIKNREQGSNAGIYDITGRLIKNTNAGEIILPIKGTYIISINNKAFKIVVK